MRTRARTALTSLVAGLTLVLSACSSASGGDDPNSIAFALDWTPNTNHTGLYVALQEGLFDAAGLRVSVLPYNDTTPDLLVDAGTAQFGISTQNMATFARAAGSRTVSVLAPLQHHATGIAVRADRADITRPRDLDGRTYAGFGDPGDGAALRQVIRNDGGRGDFESVTLGTTAYEAVYSGTADFTVSYMAWEGIEAERRGEPMRYFSYGDYAFPDMYAIVVNGNEDWLAAHPDQARAFVGALREGYRIALEDPDRGARALLEAAPDSFPDPDMVVESQRMVSERYLRADDGGVGTQTLARWRDYSSFLYRSGLLVDADGAPLTQEPDWSTYFTDRFVS